MGQTNTATITLPVLSIYPHLTGSSLPPARHRPSHQTGPFPDGDAAGDGLQRPAAQPAAAEEARLQPVAHCQRAGADGRGQPEQSCQHSALREGKQLI